MEWNGQVHRSRKWDGGFQGLGRGGSGEVMVKGYKISVIQDNSVL